MQPYMIIASNYAITISLPKNMSRITPNLRISFCGKRLSATPQALAGSYYEHNIMTLLAPVYDCEALSD